MELRKENVNAYLNYSKGALSIEVPNNRRTVVGLKSMLASPKFLNSAWAFPAVAHLALPPRSVLRVLQTEFLFSPFCVLL